MLKNLPSINFVTADPQVLLNSAIKVVEKSLGRTLGRADPIRLLLDSFVNILMQTRLLIDTVAKQNLLAYTAGDALDHLGALVGVSRLEASKAQTTVTVKLSAARETTTTIKKGTRVTADDEVFFSLDNELIFLAGEVSKECTATCTTVGIKGNGYAAGELDKITDPQPFLKSIVNTTLSEGGADVESDEDLRERIWIAPESFSVAGSEGAYIFHAKSASALISDVAVHSPQPGYVEIYVLLKDGSIPSTEMLNKVAARLNKKTVRPLTDIVTVKAPTTVSYDINLQYWISDEDSAQASRMIRAVNTAVDDYVTWQSEGLGRDLNPSELTKRVMATGVKRVDVISPVFTVLDPFSVAIARNKNIEYCGLESK